MFNITVDLSYFWMAKSWLHFLRKNWQRLVIHKTPHAHVLFPPPYSLVLWLSTFQICQPCFFLWLVRFSHGLAETKPSTPFCSSRALLITSLSLAIPPVVRTVPLSGQQHFTRDSNGPWNKAHHTSFIFGKEKGGFNTPSTDRSALTEKRGKRGKGNALELVLSSFRRSGLYLTL